MTATEHIAELVFDRHIRQDRWISELDIAVRDLLASNYFSLVNNISGPYKTNLQIVDSRMVLLVNGENFTIPTTPFKKIIKDYFLMFDSYQEALNHGQHAKLEAIDMGRRGLHNEAAETLIELLEGRVNMDFDTARRLFTIIMVLHLK